MKITPLVPLAVALVLVSCGKKEAITVEATNPPASESAPVATGTPTGDPAAPTTGAAGTAGTSTAPAGAPAASALGISPQEEVAFAAWFKKYNLKADPATMAQDADGDGFSNQEEFLADTNPRDANSMPGVADGVQLVQTVEVKVPLLLREVKDGKARVERMDGLGQEELREGGQPKGLPYRVKSVKREVKPDKHGVFTDVSNVTLEKPGSSETVTLVLDLPARSSETHAVIVGADGKEQKIRVDEIVTLPGHPGKQFKVLELRPDQVVVEELGTKRPLTILKK